MRKHAAFLFLLAMLACLAGWLLSHISLLGRVGISVAYHEYRFLKTWWMGAALLLAIWLAIYWMHNIAHLRWPRRRKAHLITVVLAALGLYATYADFRGDLTHRWLGERFHLGAYLFWIGLMLVSLRFALMPKSRVTA